MGKSIVAVVFGSIAIVVGVSIGLVLHAETVRQQRFPQPLPLGGQADRASAAFLPAQAGALVEPPSLHAEKALSAYQADVCACISTGCIVDLADRHTAVLMSLRDFNPGKAEQKALIEGIKECIELARARELPLDFSTHAERLAQREQERREVMLRREP